MIPRAALRAAATTRPRQQPAAPVEARPVPYRLVGQVRLDANGAGTAQVSPSGIDWIITSRSVNIAGATASGATASEYLDVVGDATYLQGTYDGANDSSARRQMLSPGQVLYVVWADGPPNAFASFRVAGVAYPAGQGAAHL